MIFKNANWTSRNYDCTNIVFAVTDGDEAPTFFYSGETAPEGSWVPSDDKELFNKCEQIGMVAGVRFYGFF